MLIFLHRLTRPSLALQHPLPRELEHEIGIPHTASLAYPSTSSDQQYIISANLSLPPSFGSAYVGETFACSLCANNELQSSLDKAVSGVRILAEMQTPSQSVPLQLYFAHPDTDDRENEPGSSLQKIIRFDLKEEGNHVLAVNVSYTDATKSGGQVVASKARSFRKLYQFVAQPCLSVRTKATELNAIEIPDKSLGPYGKTSLVRFALEAQLENVSEGTIVLESAKLHPRRPFKATSLNWDAGDDDGLKQPILAPRDVLQVAYVVEQDQGINEGLDELKAMLKNDGRAVLGHLSIQWRGNMGEPGSLSTGSLMTRRRIS